MKKFSIIAFLFGLLTMVPALTACEDMLTPDMDRNTDNFSGKDSVYFYLGILSNLQEVVEQNYLTADIRSDLADTTMYCSDSIASIANFELDLMDGDNAFLNRAAYYKVINQCNFYLAKVDTMAMKNNIYYMRREYAQVEYIRAWTYMQLVQQYGRVPFFTDPVNNADTGWETNPPAWATADNLLDLLGDNLRQARQYEYSLGFPQYGTFSTGATGTTFEAQRLCFYGDLILGDLYLLRGASRQDYVEAAKYYYNYITDNSARMGGMTASGSKHERSGSVSYETDATSWQSNRTDFRITVMPSAANSTFGRVLTQVPQIYGFDTETKNSTDKDLDSDDETYVTSGEVTLSPNYRSRQIGPSQGYLNLFAGQDYISAERDKATDLVTKVEYYTGLGDARIKGIAPEVRQTEGTGRYINVLTKYGRYNNNTGANNFTFLYALNLYMKDHVFLTYAEALNRAGYPRHAYAVLRSGLNYDDMPELRDSLAYSEDSLSATRVYYLDAETSIADQSSYIDWMTVDELYRAQADPEYYNMLDFSEFSSNTGIHEYGCGSSVNADSLYSYRIKVAERIEQEAARPGAINPAEARRHARTLRAEGDEAGDEGEGDEVVIADDFVPAEADPYEINAVETLICDEYALQCGFYGNRFFDLARMARHKNLDYTGTFDSEYGTRWLAWLISRRSLDLMPYEQPTVTGSLYGRLLVQDNWWLPAPVYK